MIKRELEDKIRKIAKKYPVVSVSGPRQSGKTTLVKKIFIDWKYFNLEVPEIRSYAQNDPKSFLDQSETMIIDEVQYVPELLSYIQDIVDSDKKRKFVITGSQNLLISEKLLQSLAGRVCIFHLLPLTVNELKVSKKLKKNLIEQLFCGFYPRIYGEKVEASNWYDNYVQTYLERDVRQIKNIGDLSIFQKFLGLLAGRTGQILNIASLANDVGVSVPTIESWISILEVSFVVFRLPPYFNSWNKRLMKAPKIHFFDSGLVCALLNINSVNELEKHPLLGYIFESFVCSEIYKQIKNGIKNGNMYYWRENHGKEIDILIANGEEVTSVEVKAAKTLSESLVGNLLYYRGISKQKVKLQLIYGGDENQRRSEYEVISWDKI